MTDKKKSQDKAQGVAALGGGMIASEAAANEAAATDMLREQMGLFLDTYNAKKNIDPEKLKGFLFERIEAGKFDVDAVRKDSDARACLTSDTQGRGTDIVDIEIKNKNKVLQKIQGKTSNDPIRLAREARNSKYAGMEKLVPKDQFEEVKKRAAPVDGDIVKEIKHENISSGGTYSFELKKATKNPEFYALKQEVKQVAREAGVMGLRAAAAASLIGGALSFIKNTYAYKHGDVDGKDAMKNIAKDTANVGIRSGSEVALSRVIIRHGTKKMGVGVLAKSNVAMAVASGIIDAGKTIYRYAKGEISTEEAVERLGETGCSNLAGFYMGAAAGTVFGPAGALVGSMAGYMLTASVYQSCMVIIKEAQLAEKEAERVEDICREAVKAMEKQREQFELALSEYLDEQRFAFNKCFETIDAALVEDRLIEAIQGISNLVIIFGKELQLSNFKDFDNFMTDSDEPLVL